MSVNEVQPLESRLKRNAANKSQTKQERGQWKLIHNNDGNQSTKPTRKATGFLGEAGCVEDMMDKQFCLAPAVNGRVLH